MLENTATSATVLVVDESNSTAGAIASVIESVDGLAVCGYATEPDAAGDMYERERPDVVLLDPGTESTDMWLRHMERSGDPEDEAVVIIFSTLSDPPVPSHWSSRVAAKLYKGCSTQELTKTIRSAYERVFDS